MSDTQTDDAALIARLRSGNRPGPFSQSRDEAADRLEALTAELAAKDALIGRLEDSAQTLIAEAAADKARIEELEGAIRAEAEIVQKVRNILHAHNRDDTQRLPNDQRIACRGLLEGAARRLRAALPESTDREEG